MTPDPRWLRILRDYADAGSGVTIPFLVGASRSPIGGRRTAEEDRADLRVILRGMSAGAADGSTFTIQKCSGLREYVASHYPASGSSRYFKSPPRASLTWMIDERHISDVDELEAFMWDRHRGELAGGLFSYDHHGREWRVFNHKELAAILTALGEEGREG